MHKMLKINKLIKKKTLLSIVDDQNILTENNVQTQQRISISFLQP